MKKVESEIQKLLLRGISKHGEGRANYLKIRKSAAPVDKYNFQYCSRWENFPNIIRKFYDFNFSWEHGWDIESYRQALNPSKYCRNPIVRTTFYRPNGVRCEELELLWNIYKPIFAIDLYFQNWVFMCLFVKAEFRIFLEDVLRVVNEVHWFRNF